MGSTQRIASLVCGIWLAMASLAIGQTSVESTQALLDRATGDAGDTGAFVAWTRVHRQMVAGTREDADAVHAALISRLGTAKQVSSLRRTMLLLAARPTTGSVSAIVAGFDSATDDRTQAVVCEALQAGLTRLPAEEKKVLAEPVVRRMLEIIRKPGQSSALAGAAVSCLGALGDIGYPAIQQIANDVTLRDRAADALPSALAATKDARALDVLTSLCDTASSQGHRIASIHATGALVHALRKAGTPVSDKSREAALARIRQYLWSDGEPQLLAVAIGAAGSAIGVDEDIAVQQAVIAALSHPDGHVRTAALESLMGTKTARLPVVRRLVLRLRLTESEQAVRADVDAVLTGSDAAE